MRGNDKRSFTYEESSIHEGLKGWQMLFGMICFQHDALGHVEYKVPGWVLDDVLGHGAFCSAFQAHRNSESQQSKVVLKIFEDEEHGIREANLLLRLKNALVQHVPVPIESCLINGFFYLAVTPIGRMVSPLAGGECTWRKHWIQLLDALHAAHDLDVAHRDVKPSNIFVDGNGDIILNDWGSASQLGERVPFEGTVGFCDQPDADMTHVPTAAADLIALVKTVHCMFTGRHPPPSYEDADLFWSIRFGFGDDDTVWGKCWRAASKTKYDCLKRRLQRISL